MGRMQQTLERAQDAVRSSRDAIGNGATRETAAGLVERFGAGIRKQSRRAAHATELAGGRIGGQLERRRPRFDLGAHRLGASGGTPRGTRSRR